MKRRLEIGFFILTAALLLFLGLRSHWSDSELWSLGIARFFPSGGDVSSQYKPLFSALLHLPYLLDLSNTETVLSARLIFAAFAFGSVILFFLLAKALSRNRDAALWSGFLLISSPFFLSQSYQLRSDLLALFFQLLGLLHFVRLSQESERRKAPPAAAQGWIGFLIHFLLLLSTPKGIFHFLVNFVFVWCALGPEGRKRSRSYLLKTFGLPLAGLFVLALWKRQEFLSAIRFFFSSYEEGKDHPGFFSRGSSIHARRFLLQHWFLFIFAGVGLGVLKRKNLSFSKPLAAASLTALFFIFFHSDRLPFFIYSLMPVFVMFAGIHSLEAWASLSLARRRSLSIPMVLLSTWIVIRVGTATFELSTTESNRLQIESQNIIHRYLSQHPGTLYYDGTLALPRQEQLHALPAPAHSGNLQEVLGQLDNPDLRLVFFGNKMFYYFQEIGMKMEERFFIKIGKIVLAKAHVILATQELTPSFWKSLCDKLGHPPRLFVYEGNGIFMMNPLPESPSCEGPPPRLRSSRQFLAFSAYAPLVFPEDKSFAEIFDQGKVP